MLEKMEDFENKYLEFLGNVERSFGKLDISGASMMQRLYCGLRFVEGSIRALKIFTMLDGKDLLNREGKQRLIDWMKEIIIDLES